MINRIFRRLVAEGRLWLPVSQKEVAQNVVVSLTSYPARLPQLHLVIRSLLHQSLAPREIVLYLGADTRDEDIPATLRQLEKYKQFLNEHGEIYFKTDDDELFKESLEYFKDTGFETIKLTYDLEQEPDFWQNIETEHEIKFKEQGIKIKAGTFKCYYSD